MESIDISNNINDFKQVFESESRIIFSAKFGDGKSYFLKKFMESYPKEANDYYFITLHPVNYVVEENRDVIEYIKRDILFQLIKDNRIYDFKEGYDKIFDAVCNGESLLKLADFAASIIPVNGLKEGYKALKGLVSTIDEKRKEQDVLHVVDDYLNGFYGKSGSISECDAFTYLIQKSLDQMMAKSVLIIEDLDRIDPAHLFRIMNVLSSQVDNPYYLHVPHGNKFGFDKIILVMDYEIARHLFHHFYGKEANYEGYMNKFLNTLPFRYSIREVAQTVVSNELTHIFETKEILGFCGVYNGEKFSLLESIKKFSVRRCQEFLEFDIQAHVKSAWIYEPIAVPVLNDMVKLLCYLRFFVDLPSDKMFDMLMDNLEGLLAIKAFFPLFCMSTRKTFVTLRISDTIFECYFDEKSRTVTVEQTSSWNENSMIDFEKLKGAAKSMKPAVINLIIG